MAIDRPAVNESSVERRFPQPNLKMRVFDLDKAEATFAVERIDAKRSAYSRMRARRHITSFGAQRARNCENRDRHRIRLETLVQRSAHRNA